MLLTGRPAFKAYDYKTLYTMNKEGAIEYPTNLWNKISENAQDLVKKMLEKNPDDRISAEEALNHNWFTNQDMSQS